MRENQKTLAKGGSYSGIGLHTGKPSEVFFRPAEAGSGIRFLKNGTFVGVLGKDHALFVNDSAARCSAIGTGALKVLTVEHLLAAMYGLGISNLEIDVRGEEVPAADGSAKPFIDLFRKMGLKEQTAEKYVYRVTDPLFCSESGKAISILPSDNFEIHYCLDYDFPYLRNQKAGFVITPEIFESQIAPARTFCTADEARELKHRGLGLGGSDENNIVVSPDGAHQKRLRFPDEFARHKILDVIGDLSLLGFPVTGKVICIRSGHALNREMVQAIRRQREKDGK